MKTYTTTENLITVFADASYREGHAGFACWFRNSQETHKFAQPIGWKVHSVAEAETIALSTGILSALERLHYYPGVIVVAQSDSLDTLSLFAHLGGVSAKSSDIPIQPRSKGTPDQFLFAEQAVRFIRQAHGSLYLKHVRGHTAKTDRRSFLNSWCDHHAKQAQREAYNKAANDALQDNQLWVQALHEGSPDGEASC